jgi:hypothetical protein
VSYVYSSLSEAARALLVEACTVLNERKVEYVIAGGWVPVLRGGSDRTLRHPGTRDVDVLFNDDRGAIRNAVEHLLASGLKPSAKHEFQLLKALPVGGREFLFNIDLMHPAEAVARPELFQDIMDFDIRSDYDPESPKMKSICFKSSAIIFEQNLWSRLKVAAVDLGGKEIECDVPLMDEAASILSKAESVKLDKRLRDAFDIYFLLAGPAGPTVAKRLKQLSTSFPQVSDQLSLLLKFLNDNSDKFDANVFAYVGNNSVSPRASRYVRELLFS